MTDRVIIVGVGGIGTFLSEGIVRMLEYKNPGSMLILVDGDHFEPKNQERQTFKDLGNKAEVKAAEMTPYFKETFIAPLPLWIVEDGKDVNDEQFITAENLLEEGDVVFAVVDNFAARKLLFDAARNYDNIDIFTGGNDEELFTSVYHYQRRDGADVTDHPTEYHEQLIDPPDRNPGTMSCQEKAELEGGVQLIASNMAVASMLLGRYHHTIISGNDPRPAAEIMFDLGAGLANAYDRTPDEVSVSV